MKKALYIFFLIPSFLFGQGTYTHNKSQFKYKGKELIFNQVTPITFFWDNVGTFPAVTWTTGTSGSPSTYNTPVLPNSLGTYPYLNSVNSSLVGWEAACGYANNLNTISTSIERYTGKASLHLILSPFSPTPISGMYDSGISGQGAANYRSEICTSPFSTDLPSPSELWMSWSYYFPTLNAVFDPYADPNYPTTDSSAEGEIHQIFPTGAVHPSVMIWMHASWGNNLIITLMSGLSTSGTEYAYNTHYPLVAGQWMDFVEHIQWSSTSTGLYELWCTTGGVTTQLISHTGANAYSDLSFSGTPKLGIYHWWWHSLKARYANESLTAMSPQTQLEEYLGPVKMIYRLPGNYLNASGFNLVKP
jgi:hypothetical protein